MSDPTRENFEHFSKEYAEALQALQTLESQAPTLMLMGSSDELRRFIDQFLEMATRTHAAAIDRNEPNFADWFRELIDRAEKLRDAVPRKA